MKDMSFVIGGREVRGKATYAKGVLWLHVDGETYTVETEKRSAKRGAKGSTGSRHPGELAAPMPGKIIKILVQPNARVGAHEVVLVMEAMKMEYTLKAQASGTVSEIRCQPGDQVTLGQVLVKLKVDEEKK